LCETSDRRYRVDLRSHTRRSGFRGLLDSLAHSLDVSQRRLEIFTPDELVEPIASAIMKYAHAGHPGDGKLYVIDVLEGSRIRTGERGKEIV
jgi:nitrogen regulatory protein PII